MSIFCIIFFLFVLENTWFKGNAQMQNQCCKNLGLLKSDSESENLKDEFQAIPICQYIFFYLFNIQPNTKKFFT